MQKLIKKTFEKAYNEADFKEFIKQLLTDADFDKAHEIQRPKDYKDFIRSAKRIAKYKFESDDFLENVIDVLVVKLKKTSSIDRARTAQRNFVARYLNNSRGYQKDAALVAFISEDEDGNISDEWRFSLIKMDYITEIVEDEQGIKKRKTTKELTPAKRFSFLVGASEDSHTAQTQLYKCLQKSANKEQVSLDDLLEAFSIEKVSKEFFDKYKNLFADIKEELERLYKNDVEIKNDFDKHCINIVDFSKKTLGQLVFLYFIQKKGWMGVKQTDDWGKGEQKFLRKLFDGDYGKYSNFFNNVLEPMFYGALAEDRRAEKDLFTFNEIEGNPSFRIPFLNGGLFEAINDYAWKETNITIKDDILKKVFETFDIYNFTVREDEPLEKEVAIDPEMLGKVFEELLEVTERKSKGAFYTPREIVHYMCQESLINYLSTKIEVLPKEDISEFIHIGDSTYSGKKVSTAIPERITNNALLIDKALVDIKVCDPAIGSGAFPVGMMNEIVRARKALNGCDIFKDDDTRIPYKFKSDVIENSIYGVDLDNGAVEIAKLRFWLSLVVDEEDVKEINPLPNLDYKIMQGNSLISSYEDIIDFDEVVDGYKPDTQLGLFSSASDNVIVQLREAQKEFIKESNKEKKYLLKDQIENIIVDLVKSKLKEKCKPDIEEHIKNFAKNREFRNFFPWKLYFGDVFGDGGFDVVIGNPPYIKEYTNKNAFDGLRSSKYYQGKMDLWYFFGCVGLDIIKDKAIQSFIAPNNWITNSGASKFRDKVIEDSRIIEFIDFGNYQVFDTASIQTMVYIIQKTENNELYNVKYSKLLKDKIQKDELEYFLRENKSTSSYLKYCVDFEKKDFEGAYINFLQPNISSLLNKMRAKNSLYLTENEVAQGIVPPQDFLNKKNAEILGSGYKAGEGIFNLSNNEKENLGFNNQELKDLIKPFYTTNELFRYHGNSKNKLWVIYTDSKFKNKLEIEPYPNIKKHLDRFKKVITSDFKPYGLHRSRDEKFFKGEKIISLRKCAKPTFTYTEFDCYVSQTYFVIKTDRVDQKFLTGFLNSKLIAFWLKSKGKMQGDNYQVDKEPLVNIPIPKLTKQEEKPFIDIVDKILELTSQENYLKDEQAQLVVKQYETQIDEMVYKLYELTEDEIVLIEPNRLTGFNFDTKPSLAQLVEKVAKSNPELMDNDREFCKVLDSLALNNGFEKEELPKYWSIGRSIYLYKKDNNISASETATTTSSLTVDVDLNNPILNQFKFDKKPSIREVVKQIAEYDIAVLDNDRKLIELFDGIALTNGYEKTNLPKYWTIIRASFDYKKEAMGE